MLIHPFDSSTSPEEWQAWLATTDHFGILAVNNANRDEAPVVIPTHFTLVGDEIMLHLATMNKVWEHLTVASRVSLTVIGDYAFVPGYWRAKADAPASDGVPTSYYASVQFTCAPTIVDDPAEKAEIIAAQLRDMQPEGHHADMSSDAVPYGTMLPEVRGLRLAIVSVAAKFKYDDHKSPAFRERVAELLDERGRPLDAGAATEQRTRLDIIGDWRKFRATSQADQTSTPAEE